MKERERGRERESGEGRKSIWWREGREEIVYPTQIPWERGSQIVSIQAKAIEMALKCFVNTFMLA